MTNIAKEYTSEQFVKLNEVPMKLVSNVKVTRTVRETFDKVTITIQAVVPKGELEERKVDLSGLDALTEMLGDIFEKNVHPTSTTLPTSPPSSNPPDVGEKLKEYKDKRDFTKTSEPQG